MTTPTATQRALRCLHDGGWSGVAASEVGACVWPDRACRPGRGVSVNGGGDYAAQMLLGRLKKAGLVEYATSEGSSRWRLSTKGRDEIRKITGPKAHGGGAVISSSDPCTCGCAPEEGVTPSIRGRRAAPRATAALPTKRILGTPHRTRPEPSAVLRCAT